uniref:Uncharacterized protein n=1 Tax=Panagrolaimus davidi TaxID=227884 RepID=A0A914QUF1_9BILA
MFRFINVKNDNSAAGDRIIWDEEINILQPEVIANLDELRNGKEIVLLLKSLAVEDKKEDQSDSIEFKLKVYEFENYSSDMPLLEEHQKELSPIWSTFKPKSIITGRRTMRRLSETANGVYTLKKIKVGENEYYILHQPYSIEAEKNVYKGLFCCSSLIALGRMNFLQTMSRFFNVKNDNSADREKIIWDEEINILQPEVVANLDELRNGKEIVLPLKSVAVEDKKENQSEESEGGTNEKEESDEDTKEERFK